MKGQTTPRSISKEEEMSLNRIGQEVSRELSLNFIEFLVDWTDREVILYMRDPSTGMKRAFFTSFNKLKKYYKINLY